MKNNLRLNRINDEILKEISYILKDELKNPKLNLIISPTKVTTSNDLSYCDVYISIFGTDNQKVEALESLKKSSGYVRKLISQKINLRHTPEIRFSIDDSLDYSYKISNILKESKNNGTDFKN